MSAKQRHVENGFCNLCWADPMWSLSVTTSPSHCLWTQEFLRDAYLAPSCTHCSLMTMISHAQPCLLLHQCGCCGCYPPPPLHDKKSWPFYRCTIQSILIGCMTVWFGNCSLCDHKALQRVMRAADLITGNMLSVLQDTFHTQCLRKAHKIIIDHTHSAHRQFTGLASGRRNHRIQLGCFYLEGYWIKCYPVTTPSTLGLMSRLPPTHWSPHWQLTVTHGKYLHMFLSLVEMLQYFFRALLQLYCH